MKKIFYLFCAFVAVGSVSSCQKGEDIDKDKIILRKDVVQLKARVSYKNAGLLNIQNALGGDKALMRSGIVATEGTTLNSQNENFSLALVAEVSSPVYEGKILRSTHVTVSGNYAYVTYNTEGEVYLGGVDVIDISDINNPRLVLSAELPNVDVNSVAIDGNKLLLAGAADVDKFVDLKTPAWAAYLPLNNGLLGTNYDFIGIKGQASLDAVSTPNNNYVVSGSNGVLAKLNKQTGAVEVSLDIPDLRSVRSNGSHIIVLSGATGLKVYNQSLVEEKQITTLPNAPESKRVFDLYKDYVIVPEGKEGFATYNLTGGNLVKRYAIPSYEGNDNELDSEDIVTNAVSVNGDRLFAANGGAGIAIYNFDSSKTATLLGTASFSGLDKTSSNFVVSSNKYVFVASGRGGLKILKMIDLTPGPDVPTCNGTYGPFTGSTQSDFNINSGTQSYSDVKVFNGSVNVNGTLNWCGVLQVNGGQVAVNGNATLNMYGTLAVLNTFHVNNKANIYGSATIGRDLNINGGAVLTVVGSLAQGNSGLSTTMHVNGELVIDGEVAVYGDLRINGGGKVRFVNTNSKLIVSGKLTNNGKVEGGTITKL